MKTELEDKIKALEKERALLGEIKQLKEIVELSGKAKNYKSKDKNLQEFSEEPEKQQYYTG
ncbi:MAG: hypothetical protein QW468_01140 [Candidatus Bathyarchaeia archaeon]